MLADPAPTAEQPLVILVDDDDALCSAVKFSLELDGFQVAVCSTGEALLKQTLPAAHACLVLDERLPGMSGLQTLDALRRRNIDLPALLITTHPTAAFSRAAAVAQAPIIEKPLLGDTLVGGIRSALAAHPSAT